MTIDSIPQKIKQRLRESEYWTPKTRDNGNYIQGIKCPECGQDAWAYAEKPFSIICNRLKNCGARTKALQLFPELIQNIEKNFKPTKDDPNRPATEYCRSRGLNGSLTGVNYRYFMDVRGCGSGAVMFQVTKDVLNGRIFNPPKGEDKSHNRGSTSGIFWQHSKLDYSKVDTVFLTESIIDALSLIEMGKFAISVLSAGSDPAKFDLPFKHLTIAFDNDTAGIKAVKKWREVHPDADVMLPPPGQDWNDVLMNHLADPPKAFSEQAVEEMKFNGRLALATKAQEYAEIYSETKDKSLGIFEFDGCLYFSTIKKKNDEDEVTCAFVGDFTTSVNHFALNDSIPDRPEHSINVNVMPKRGRKKTFTASATELATPGKQRELFMNRALVSWEGDYRASCAFGRKILHSKAPVVRQILTIGHDAKSGCYVFPHFCFKPCGNSLLPENGMYKISHREYLRPANINTIKPQRGIEPVKVYNLIAQAWPNIGPAALSWLAGSWFIHEIKGRIGFYPFLSMHGDTQCGKTVLMTKLNALQGFDEEGMPMSKANTTKGEIRKLARLSSMAKALLESQGQDRSRFDFDNILSLYNSNTLQVRAVKNYGLETDDLPFLGAIAFIQNREPFVSRPQKERVVSLNFKQAFLNDETTAAVQKLQQIPLGQLAYFLGVVLHARKDVEGSWHDEFLGAAKFLLPEIGNKRISENYALILAFHRILCRLIGASGSLEDFIVKAGQAKVAACESDEAPVATEFLYALMELDESTKGLNAVCNLEDDSMYLRPTQSLLLLQNTGLMCQVALKDLLDQLKRHPAFIASQVPHRYTRESYKSWKFNVEKI